MDNGPGPAEGTGGCRTSPGTRRARGQATGPGSGVAGDPTGGCGRATPEDPGSVYAPRWGGSGGNPVGRGAGVPPRRGRGDLCALDPGPRADRGCRLIPSTGRCGGGGRCGGPPGRRGPGGGRAPVAVLLDMGGVVIPTLFESVAVAGFPGGPFRGEAEYAAVERGELAERDYWARLAERRPDLDVGALWRACSRVRGEVRGAMARLPGGSGWWPSPTTWPTGSGRTGRGGSRSWPGSTRWWRRPGWGC